MSVKKVSSFYADKEIIAQAKMRGLNISAIARRAIINELAATDGNTLDEQIKKLEALKTSQAQVFAENAPIINEAYSVIRKQESAEKREYLAGVWSGILAKKGVYMRPEQLLAGAK